MPPKPKNNQPTTPKPSIGARIANIAKLFVQVVKTDKTALPLMLLAFAIPVLLLVLLSLAIGFTFQFIILGVAFGLLAAFAIFARRVQSTSYKQAEGQPGAALGVVSTMRGTYLITQAVQVEPRSQSMVHRVISRGGIVLLVEGDRGGSLVGNEVRLMRRVAGDTPLTVYTIGREEGETPLDKLQGLMLKLPRVLTDAEAGSLDKRLKAIAGGPSLPMPKGPMPGKQRMPKADRRGR